MNSLTSKELVALLRERIADNVYSAILHPNRKYRIVAMNDDWYYVYDVCYDKKRNLLEFYKDDAITPFILIDADRYCLSWTVDVLLFAEAVEEA